MQVAIGIRLLRGFRYIGGDVWCLRRDRIDTPHIRRIAGMAYHHIKDRRRIIMAFGPFWCALYVGMYDNMLLLLL